ncbi:hypothetical protein [Leuconostoc citreum]|uniref:hypothetical protein n=1 Tax=Leuconostoc citreum TaxID=33964 RepID=UPI0032DE57DE
MDKQTKKRLIHIRDATDVNMKHKDNLARSSVERHERAKIQIKREVMDNRQIDYKRHMKWIGA